MEMMSAYFDESGLHHTHAVVSFSGLCVRSEGLKVFEDKWRRLLDRYRLREFHMVDAIRNGKKVGLMKKGSMTQRIEELKPFADCIADHFQWGLQQAFDVSGFGSWTDGAKFQLGQLDDPQLVGFVNILLGLCSLASNDQKIAVFCDDHEAKSRTIMSHYWGVRGAHPDVKKKIVCLASGNSRYIPGLQAADMVSFLVRHEAQRQFFGADYGFRDLYLYLIKGRRMQKIRWHERFADRTLVIDTGIDVERTRKEWICSGCNTPVFDDAGNLLAKKVTRKTAGTIVALRT